MTSLNDWENCVQDVKIKYGVTQKPFMFIHGSVLKEVQKCYCTKKIVNNKRNKNVKK